MYLGAKSPGDAFLGMGGNDNPIITNKLVSFLATVYWYAYFIVILPILGVIEKPKPLPETIEAAFAAKINGKSDSGLAAAGAEVKSYDK
jgi:hypothetical protein